MTGRRNPLDASNTQEYHTRWNPKAERISREDTGPNKKKEGDATGSNSELNLHVNDPFYNSLWRQFDSLVDLPLCSCDSATKLKDHKDLMRLMQFLMGLDDAYSVVRSQILTTEPLRDVKSAFTTLSRVKSYKNSLVHTSSASPSSFAFVSHNRSNTWSNNRNSQGRGTSGNNNLVCKHCHMTRHTIDRCFELNGYPPGFKKRNYGGTNVIMALIGLKPDSGELQSCVAGATQHMTFSTEHLYDVINVSHLKIIVSHPNGTVDLVKHRGCWKDDSDGILKTPDYVDVSTDTSPTATSSSGASTKGVDAKLYDDEYEYEGEDFVEFNQLFDSDHINNPESYVLRRSSRQHKMPAKFDNYVLDKMVRYDINYVVSYANLSIKNFVFSNNLNKIHEPRSYAEAASDPRWVEAINQEMEALNSNKTLEIIELPKGRKAIGLNGYSKLNISQMEKWKVKIVTVRCLLTVAVSNKWLVYQLDINNAFLYVHCLSQFMHAPCQSHLKLTFHVLRYLKSSPRTSISFKHETDLNLCSYVDYDWAKCKITRKSVTGYVVYIGSNLVSWKSKKQYVLAKSSAEAEYRAMNSITCEVMWILKILKDLYVNVDLHVSVSCDSSSAIQIAANPVFHERTKNFKIDLYFLRKKVYACLIKTCNIKSEDNVVDLFTKGLSIKDHHRFCNMSSLLDLYHK
ncbi:ribonuclease H-like domain-containing protein [Tanacetum coccineum]